MSLLTGERRGAARGRPARERRRADRGARRDPRRHRARAGLRRARAHAAERGRHRPRDRPRCRSRRDLRRAQKHLRAAIGERLGAALADTYARMITPGPYRPDAEGAGRRALKNVCLDLLAATQDSDAIAPRASAISTRRQHDRPHGGARDACRCTTGRSARTRSTISTGAMPTIR